MFSLILCGLSLSIEDSLGEGGMTDFFLASRFFMHSVVITDKRKRIMNRDAAVVVVAASMNSSTVFAFDGCFTCFACSLVGFLSCVCVRLWLCECGVSAKALPAYYCTACIAPKAKKAVTQFREETGTDAIFCIFCLPATATLSFMFSSALQQEEEEERQKSDRW